MRNWAVNFYYNISEAKIIHIVNTVEALSQMDQVVVRHEKFNRLNPEEDGRDKVDVWKIFEDINTWNPEERIWLVGEPR